MEAENLVVGPDDLFFLSSLCDSDDNPGLRAMDALEYLSDI